VNCWRPQSLSGVKRTSAAASQNACLVGDIDGALVVKGSVQRFRGDGPPSSKIDDPTALSVVEDGAEIDVANLWQIGRIEHHAMGVEQNRGRGLANGRLD